MRYIIALYALIVGACHAAELNNHFYGPFSSATYEAESQDTNGKIIRREDSTQSEASEASGGAAVVLSHASDYINIKAKTPGNALIIRFYAKTEVGSPGQGQLRIVEGKQQTLTEVSSEFCCVFGSHARGDIWTPNSKDPQGAESEWRYFDEVKVTLPKAWSAGDSIQIYPIISHSLAYLTIDTVELIQLAPPLPKPDRYISVKDTKYGAKGDGITDDTAAIEKAILDAQNLPGAKGIWLPAGEYIQTHPIGVKNISVVGAGAWYTILHGVGDSKDWAGVSGLAIIGDNVSIQDISIYGNAKLRGNSGNGVAGGGNNTTLKNIWIHHTGTGLWIGADHPISNILISNLKISSTCADGININRNVHYAQVEWNFIRGTGDDGLANFSSIHASKDQMNGHNTFSNNLVVAPYFANGIGLYGGDGIIIRDNIVQDTSRGSGILVSGDFEQNGGQGSSILRNIIIRGGGYQWGKKYAAIRVAAGRSCIKSLNVNGNRIIASKFSPTEISGDPFQSNGCFSPLVNNNQITPNNIEEK